MVAPRSSLWPRLSAAAPSAQVRQPIPRQQNSSPVEPVTSAASGSAHALSRHRVSEEPPLTVGTLCASWFRRHKILAGIGVVLALLFGSAMLSGIVDGIRHPPASLIASDATTSNPAITASAPAVATPVNKVPAAATRGLLDSISWWDRTHQHVSEAVCAAQGEVKLPVGILDGWKINAGGVACFNDIGDGTGPPWGGRIVTLNVYFPHHVTERVAARAVAALLPADAQAGGPLPGTNNDDSATPEGSCQQIVYTSVALASAVRDANSAWPGDPSKADVVFYSGHATSDGSDKTFSASSVTEVMIGIGDDDPRGRLLTC